MSTCKTKHCHNWTRPSPGALYCPECHESATAKLQIQRPPLRLLASQKLPTTDWLTGPPNVTCPACDERYHYGAGAPYTHLCPLCSKWLCWEIDPTGETRTETQRIAKKCPTCNKVLQKKSGKYGPWWGCTWVSKGHKDNCRGRRNWSDCDTESFEVPRLSLAVWEPPVWEDTNSSDDDGDPVEHFAKLDRETQKRKTAIEEREARYKPKWWQRAKGAGIDELLDSGGEL